MEEYIKNNRLTLFLVFSAVLVGVTIGAFGVLRLSGDLPSTLYAGLNSAVADTGIFSAFLKSLQNEFKRFIIIFVCGITVIGSPVIVFHLGFCGYALGFSSAFLMKYYGLAGFLAVLGGILPHYFLLMPTYIGMGIIGINFSNRLLRGERRLNSDFKTYILKMILLSFLILLSCIVEGFVSTMLLKSILKVIS